MAALRIPTDMPTNLRIPTDTPTDLRIPTDKGRSMDAVGSDLTKMNFFLIIPLVSLSFTDFDICNLNF